MAALEVQWLGRVPYRAAWQKQHELVAARRRDEIPDQLLLLEHPAVLTLGRTSDEWTRLKPRDANFYNVAMGTNLPLAVG